MQTNQIAKKQLDRLDGYFSHRYRNGSYKARKFGIGKPIVMTARRCGDRLRLYGDNASDTQLKIAKGIFAGWKQKERELRRLARLAAKDPGTKLSASTLAVLGNAN